MSIKLTRIDGNHFILHDGLNMVVSESENYKVRNVRIKEDMAKAIYKTITSFVVALNMHKNYFSKPALQTFVIDDGVSELDDLSSAVLDLNRSARLEKATLFVSSDVGAIPITGNTLVELVSIIKDAGAEPDPTFGEYTNIKSVIEVPSTITMEDGVVYVLSNDHKGYAAGTAFKVVREDGKATRCVYDTKTALLEPTAYGDPEDAESYPYTPESMEEVSGSVGRDDIPTAEVVNSILSETTTIAASENINIVNCNGTDTCVKVTLA
jgi:hypothetical protein